MNANFQGLLRKGAIDALIFLPTIYFLAEHTYQFTTVKGSSMAPALNEFQGTTTRLLINKWPKFRYDNSSLKIDDVVYIRLPLDPSRFLVKRIKGLQGDIIKTRREHPKSLVKVPMNHVWVEGDNYFHSIDSNDFGAVSVGLIEAKVVGKISFSEWPVIKPLTSTGGREARASKTETLLE